MSFCMTSKGGKGAQWSQFSHKVCCIKFETILATYYIGKGILVQYSGLCDNEWNYLEAAVPMNVIKLVLPTSSCTIKQMRKGGTEESSWSRGFVE